MDGFNVLRGREPIKSTGDSGFKYCAGYIKYLPARGKLYGIEFSGYNKDTKAGATPNYDFDYYIFCSENAWINFLKTEGITITNKLSKAGVDVGNPATFIVSSDKYEASSGIKYPHNIGFAGSDYDNAEPRPYANADGFINSNNVQYPLYLYVRFTKPTNVSEELNINELDYQLIYES